MKPNNSFTTDESTGLLNAHTPPTPPTPHLPPPPSLNVAQIQQISKAKTTNESPKVLLDAKKPVVRRQPLSQSLSGDSQAPRRLSQLFVPLKQDEFVSGETKSNESCSLVEDKINGTPPPPKHVDHSLKQQITSKNISDIKAVRKSISDIESNSSSKSVNSSGSDSDEEEDKFTSMNDTICSNRSSYFKYYYLGSKSGDDSKSRTSRASSLSSLASLIKEKKSVLMASKEKKKLARDDIGLISLVVVLFLVLVIGVSLIYYFYYKHLLQLSLFKRLKYNEEDGILELFDSKGNLAIIAEMGGNLAHYSKPEECTEYLKHIYHLQKERTLSTEKEMADSQNETTIFSAPKSSIHEFQFDNETVCLDWTNHARVQIHNAFTYDSVNCYNVFWMAHFIGVDLKDCFHISSMEAGVWWGLGDLTDGGYPLENVNDLPSTLFLTSNWERYPWGKILRRVFVSSNGGIITLPDHLAARIEIADKKLCISTNASDFVNTYRPLTLNYTLCSSPNMSSTVAYLHFLAQDSLHSVLMAEKYESNLKEIKRRIANPTWITPIENVTTISQDSILEYVKSIEYKNKTVIGDVLLPLSWQDKIGQFTFDETRFPDPNNLRIVLESMGYNLVLTISPIVATNTNAFEEGVIKDYWVKQKDSALPMLLRSNDISAAALTDFTSVNGSAWFISQVEKIHNMYGINNFHLSIPDSRSLSVYHEFHQNIANPDLYLQSLFKSINRVAFTLGTDAAIVPPPMPTFITVGSSQSNWKSLETLIPRMLTLSMLGYPLIDAGPIGGSIYNITDKELYVRWVQAVAFLPVFQLSVLPSMYNNDTRRIVEKFIKLRKDLVIPRLYASINNTIIDNKPLILPLGIIYPYDLQAAAVSNQWIIGNDLLVAPVLCEGATSRDIYIPEGLWESQSDGKLKKGPGWLYNYQVPLSELAYFVKRYSITLSG